MKTPSEVAGGDRASAPVADWESEAERLHPSSFLFVITRVLRGFLGPAVILAVMAGSGSRWLLAAPVYLPLIAIALLGAFGRYFSFRYALFDEELVIREGILSRSVRHIPYERIQNLDLVQGPLHRLLGVADLRIETAGGGQTEAVISVLKLDRIEALREAVQSGASRRSGSRIGSGTVTRSASGAGAASAGASAGSDSAAANEGGAESAGQRRSTLYQVTPGQLVLLGLSSNRGVALALGGLGLVAEASWQFDLFDGFSPTSALTDLQGLAGASWMSPARLALAGIGIGLLIILLELASIAWIFVRLQGFTLEIHGRELRIRYGLLTRFSASLPARRVQTISTSDTALLRHFGYTRVSVSTAGRDASGSDATGRLWLAPILKRDDVAALADSAGIVAPPTQGDPAWLPTHSRAESRLRRRRLVLSTLLLAPLISFLTLLDIPRLPQIAIGLGLLLFASALISSRIEARRSGYRITEQAVSFRRGWWSRSISTAPIDKIQAVSAIASPFDRRAGMASLHVDTAGRGAAEHRLSMPYLDADQARLAAIKLVKAADRSRYRGS